MGLVHELDEPDQACRSCGGALEPMKDQFEKADEIDVVERWWVGSVAREDAVSDRLLPSRSTDAARTVLRDYSGVAISGGYKAYDTLAREREGSDLTLAHCWAHVRRKFVEAEPHYPEASEILDQIGQLYAIEAEAKRALPRSALGKAIAYASGLWPGQVRFLADPKIPLDTNGVEPRAYLREATLRAVRSPGTATLARDLESPGSREKSAIDMSVPKRREWRTSYP